MIDRDSDLHPPFCCRGLLVGANGCAVDHLDVAVVSGGNGVHHPIPSARLPPSHETIVAGGTRTIPLGKITPWRTGAQHPEDAVKHAAIIDTRDAARLVGKQRFDHAPLEVSQIISAHAGRESEFNAMWKHQIALNSKAPQNSEAFKPKRRPMPATLGTSSNLTAFG